MSKKIKVEFKLKESTLLLLLSAADRRGVSASELISDLLKAEVKAPAKAKADPIEPQWVVDQMRTYPCPVSVVTLGELYDMCRDKGRTDAWNELPNKMKKRIHDMFWYGGKHAVMNWTYQDWRGLDTLLYKAPLASKTAESEIFLAELASAVQGMIDYVPKHKSYTFASLYNAAHPTREPWACLEPKTQSAVVTRFFPQAEQKEGNLRWSFKSWKGADTVLYPVDPPKGKKGKKDKKSSVVLGKVEFERALKLMSQYDPAPEHGVVPVGRIYNETAVKGAVEWDSLNKSTRMAITRRFRDENPKWQTAWQTAGGGKFYIGDTSGVHVDVDQVINYIDSYVPDQPENDVYLTMRELYNVACADEHGLWATLSDTSQQSIIRRLSDLKRPWRGWVCAEACGTDDEPEFKYVVKEDDSDEEDA